MSFENNTFRTLHARYFTPTIEIKDCNIIIVEEIFFLSVSTKWYEENIRKHLKDCDCSRRWLHHWLFAKLSEEEDISKDQEFDVDPKAMQQINFNRSLDCIGRIISYYFL